MSRLRPLALAALTTFALVFIAGPAISTALAAPLTPVADCLANNGKLTETYTAAQLEKSLKTLTTTTNEYTDCYDAISNALSHIQGKKPFTGSTAGGSGGGSGTIIIIVVVVVVLLGGGGAATWAYRRNRDGSGPPTT